MSDRTSPEIFVQLFNALAAGTGPLDRKEFAAVVYRVMWSVGGDFHPCDMEIDNVLIGFGLARITSGGVAYLGEPDFER